MELMLSGLARTHLHPYSSFRPIILRLQCHEAFMSAYRDPIVQNFLFV